MKKLLLASAAIIALTLTAPAHAQIATFCTNCATLPVQLEDAAKNAWSWAQDLIYQVQQLEQQIASVQWLIQNTVSLPGRIANDLTSPIYQAKAMVEQAEMLGQSTRFMISNLGSNTGYGGYGGSLSDIPYALKQQNYALSNAMQQLGLVSRQVSTLSTQCTTQYASADALDPEGIKAATMVGTSIASMTGQCSEARAQLQAAYQNAMATAELRNAERQAMIDATSQSHLLGARNSACGAITNASSSWVCASSSQGTTQ